MDVKIAKMIRDYANILNDAVMMGEKDIVKKCLESILLDISMLCMVYDFDVIEMQKSVIEQYKNANY